MLWLCQGTAEMMNQTSACQCWEQGCIEPLGIAYGAAQLDAWHVKHGVCNMIHVINSTRQMTHDTWHPIYCARYRSQLYNMVYRSCCIAYSRWYTTAGAWHKAYDAICYTPNLISQGVQHMVDKEQWMTAATRSLNIQKVVVWRKRDVTWHDVMWREAKKATHMRCCLSYGESCIHVHVKR